MARLLLVSIFCIAICFSGAAKLDHKKKPLPTPVEAQEPQDDKAHQYTDMPQEGSDEMPPSDLPPNGKPSDKPTGKPFGKPMDLPSTASPSEDSTDESADTGLGNDMGPSPPKPLTKPKTPAFQKEDINEPEKPITRPKTKPSKKGSMPPFAGTANFGSAVKIMATAQAGIDFPAYSMDDMPQTSFSCDQQQFPGYYADPEAQCQVFHYCTFKVEGMITVPISFLCPNYTVFDQRTLSCNWFYQVDCSQAVNFYEKINSRLYQTALPLIDDEPDMNSPREPLPPKGKKPVHLKNQKKVKEEESNPSEQI